MNPLESISTGEPYMSPTNRITMGSQVTTQDVWPWMVELGFVGDSSATTVGQYPYTVEKRCTGTIIDTHWIVTAAYCCDGMEKVHLDFGVLERSTLGIFFYFESYSFSNTVLDVDVAKGRPYMTTMGSLTLFHDTDHTISGIPYAAYVYIFL